MCLGLTHEYVRMKYQALISALFGLAAGSSAVAQEVKPV